MSPKSMPPYLTLSQTIPSFDQELLFVQSWQNSVRPHHNFIFLHGVGGDSNAMVGSIQQTLRLIKNCRCLAYDLRGHGLSSKKFPKGIDQIETIGAADLQAVCQFFKTKKFVPIGHCFAGMIILSYATLRLKPAIEQAVLINTPLSTRIGLPLKRTWWLSLLTRLPTSTRQKQRSWLFHVKFKNTFDFHPIRIFYDFATTGLLQLSLNILSIINWRLTDYSAIDKPGFYFIRGDHDLFFPANFQKKSLAKLSQARRQQLTMNHHQIFTKYPDLLARELFNIIKSS